MSFNSRCKNTYLVDAVTNSNLAGVQRVSDYNSDCKCGRCNLHHLLYEAINKKRRDIVELLLSRGADICSLIDSKIKSLQFVRDKDIAKLVFNNIRSDGYTPLAYFAKMGNKDIVKQILDLNIHINNVVSDNGINALAAAAEASCENLDLIKFLVEQNACINPSNAELPLICAIRTDKINVVEYLVSVGANVNKMDKHKNVPLSEAVKKQNKAIIEYLFKHGAHHSMHSVFVDVIATRNVEIIKMFIEKGVQPNLRNKNGTTALLEAVRYRNLDVVKILLENKADPNFQDLNGITPLLKATEWNDLKIVETLLQNKADPNLYDSNGITPLLKATELENLEIVERLLQNRPDLNYHDLNGTTALLKAIEIQNSAIVKKLLQNNADANCETVNGTVPLIEASELTNMDIILFLLDYGADINRTDQNGKTAFEILLKNKCAGKKFTEVATRFIELGAEFDIICEDGYSPLTKFVYFDEIKMVKYLLSKGADPNTADPNGKTPLEIAASNLNFDIFEYLIHRGAKIHDVKQQLDEIASKNEDIFGFYWKNIQTVTGLPQKENHKSKVISGQQAT